MIHRTVPNNGSSIHFSAVIDIFMRRIYPPNLSDRHFTMISEARLLLHANVSTETTLMMRRMSEYENTLGRA